MEHQTMSDDRLEKIEITLAHQDQLLQELSDAALEQAREIARLKRDLGKARDKIDAIEAGATEDDSGLSPGEIAARDKPPHY